MSRRYEIISSIELESSVDMVCDECGLDHAESELFGGHPVHEGEDYFFLSNGKSTICLCVTCEMQRRYGVFI